MKKPCVLASNNAGKLREIKAILAGSNIELLPQNQFKVSEAEETGLSFIENAIIKARHACEQTGLPAIADDSGLEVFALNGEPGIFSARYADPLASKNTNDSDNLAKVLSKLADNPCRKARFVCTIALLKFPADPTPVLFQGFWQGEISYTASGSGGFGYDPIFYLAELQCSSAQLSAIEKDKLSHRAQALAQLKKFLHDNPLYL